MTSTSTESHIDDRHFLRIGAESDSGSDPDRRLPQHCFGSASAASLWPLPNGAETLLEKMALWDRYAVLAVHIDAAAKTKISNAFRTKLKKLLADMVASNKGVWFDWQTHRYGAIVPQINAEAALSLAQTLQTDLADHHIETVSIGISEYPFARFDHHQSLINAAKALDHGAFFGADTCVTFDSVSLNISGDQYYQTDDLEGAIHEYRLALDLDATNVNARNSLGVCLAEKGELEAAQSQFDVVCQTHPNDAMALFNIGLIHLNQEEDNSARSFFERAYAVDQNTFEIPYQLGKLLYEQGELNQALEMFEASEKIRDNYAPLFSLMGRCLSELQQIEPAICAYKKAIKRNPNDAAALSDLGLLYAEKGENLDICTTFCRQGVTIEPKNSLYRYRLARLYHKHQQWDQALTEYAKAAELGYDVEKQMAEIHKRVSTQEDDTMRCA